MSLLRTTRRNKSRKWFVRILALPTAILLSAGVSVPMFSVPAFASGSSGNTNSASYWEGQFEHQATCYKHDGNSSHGAITNSGKAVTLATFNQSWPGDHWEALIVKGGSVDSGSGPGNVVYTHPTAGTPYFAPLNAGGQQSDVSHWIVCKGTTPQTTPKDAVASISTTSATCDMPGTLVLGNVTNATWGDVTYSGQGNLNYSVTATTSDGHKFPAGAGVSSDGKTKTFSGELGAATLDCPTTPAASSTNETCDAIGSLTLGSGHYTWQLTIDKDVPELSITKGVPFTVPSGTWLATFSALGNDPSGPRYYGTVIAQATADPGYSLESSQSKWTFTFTEQDCRTIVTPVKPAITEVETCDTYGSVTPVETEGVNYAVEFDKVTGAYTVTATPKDGHKFEGPQSVVFTGNVGAYVACPGVVTPATPKANDQCEVSNDKYDLPSNSEGISYAFDSKKGVVATLTGTDFTFSEILPAGYVKSEDGLSATYAYSNFKWTNESCDTLAYTGVNTDEMKGILLLSGGLLLIGGLALAYSRRRKMMTI